MKLKAILYVPENKDNYQIEVYSEEKSRQVAEIYKDENDKLKIEIFNNPDEGSWDLDLKYLIDFLQKSYKELAV